MPPVRLCCGERHSGPMCPDGKVMCCLCFDRFEVEDLSVVEGVIENVCKECKVAEEHVWR